MASLRTFTRGATGPARWQRLVRRAGGGASRHAGGERSPRPPTLLLVSGGVCVAIAALVWLGYVATSEWMRYTELLLERRKAEALALAAAALSQDMKGAWTTVLAPMNPKTLEEDPPYD